MAAITQEIRNNLKNLLIKHEGCENKVYFDSQGYMTIGVGRNLSGRGITSDEIEYLLNNDINYFYDALSQNFSWFEALDDARKIALVDMSFMGLKNFMTFHKMIDALSKHDYERAAEEVLKSKYAEQVKRRAEDIANILRTGTL